MDNVLIVSLVFWPVVMVACAGINMAISRTFSWAELVFAAMIGVIAGSFMYAGTQPDPSPVINFFFVFSHGVPALIWWIADGFMDPGEFIALMGPLRLCAVGWAAGLDRIATQLGPSLGWAAFGFSLLVAPAKLLFPLATSAVGVLIWLAGFGWAIGRKGKVSFAGGVLLAEFVPDARGFRATTLGWTVHTWSGRCPYEHELYHTRQYIYMGDWLVPFWLLGCLWGMASVGRWSRWYAIAASGDKGNPIEIAAYKL